MAAIYEIHEIGYINSNNMVFLVVADNDAILIDSFCFDLVCEVNRQVVIGLIVMNFHFITGHSFVYFSPCDCQVYSVEIVATAL